jgi:aminomethyltransferase
MSALGDEVIAVRRAAGLFRLSSGPGSRGVIAVTGSDARRWLDGMVTNDVTRLAAAGPANGCYAALLTQKGRILADLHVLARPDGFWLETAASAVPDLIARLERYVVADDVKLAALDLVRLGVEGPAATSVIARASQIDPAQLASLPAESWTTLSIGGVETVAARFGWSGEDAWQLFVPGGGERAGTGGEQPVVAALREAGQGALALPSNETLSVLRIEAGIPAIGSELNEEVFPDEARLESAISRKKGCYTGQEIVARLYSRGAVNHLLVSLRFEGSAPPPPGSKLFADDRATGEVTSACLSPTAAAIGLGYVRRDHAAPGTRLLCGEPGMAQLAAVVAERPLVSASLPAQGP